MAPSKPVKLERPASMFQSCSCGCKGFTGTFRSQEFWCSWDGQKSFKLYTGHGASATTLLGHHSDLQGARRFAIRFASL